MKRAGPKPPLFLPCMGVCLLKPYCLQPWCHCERQDFRSSHITKAQAPFRATLATPPGHPAFLPLLTGSTSASSTTLHSTLLWVLTADFFCVFHHQRGPVPPRAWDQAELQITPPVPRLALRIIVADCTHFCLPISKHVSIDPYKQEFHVPRWWMWVCK